MNLRHVPQPMQDEIAALELRYDRVRKCHDVEFLACECPPLAWIEGIPVRPVAMLTGPSAVLERALCSCGVVSRIRNGDGSTLLGRE
jgi:hypothetical protein